MGRIQRLRQRAATLQNNRCYYCGCFMWHGSVAAYAARASIAIADAKRFQCTAEHLLAQAEGGGTNAANIVAACLACNNGRHRGADRPGAAEYLARISGQRAEAGAIG